MTESLELMFIYCSCIFYSIYFQKVLQEFLHGELCFDAKSRMCKKIQSAQIFSSIKIMFSRFQCF